MNTVIEKSPSNRIKLAPYGVDADGQPYGPNPTQQRVLDWVDEKREVSNPDCIPVLYLQGGVGSGKTRAFVAPVDELLLEIPGIRILWGRQDLKDINLSVVDMFFEILPRALIKASNKQYNYYDIKQPGGMTGRIYFNGLKDLSGLSSQEFSIIVITEGYETTENAYRTLKRRCRQASGVNLILIESEPPNEDHWLSRLTDPMKDEYDPDIEKWELSTYENAKNLPPSYLGSLESMPAAWKRKYMYGKTGFIPDGKPFYTGFKEELHVGDFEWNPERPLILGWDFGFHHPAVLITQIDLYDRWVFLKEIMGTDILIDAFGDKVIQELNLHYPNAELIHYGDPACKQVNDKSEKTSWAILKEKGIFIIVKTSTYRDRKEIIDGKLSKLIGGKPSILVDRSCKIVVDGFLGGYHYPVIKPGQAVTDKNEQPVHDDFYSHLMNCAEYISVNMFKAIERKVAKTRHPQGRV